MRDWCEKVRHKSVASANEHAERLSDGRPPHERVHSYACGNCGGWHVGHVVPRWRLDTWRGAEIAIQKVLDRYGVEAPADAIHHLVRVAAQFAQQGYMKALKGETWREAMVAESVENERIESEIVSKRSQEET